MSDVLLRLRNVSKSYQIGKGAISVLSGLQAEFLEQERVTIRGASGSGKSTLLQLLGGLDKPDQGEVLWQGEVVSKWSRHQLAEWRRHQLGLVFQSYQLLPELTALENVELPAMIANQVESGVAERLLDRVGLGSRLHHRPNELSGGEQQRVAIARALRNHPRLILADEPTGNLDQATGEKVMALLFEVSREQGVTLVLVTHNAELAALGDRQLLLANGNLQ